MQALPPLPPPGGPSAPDESGWFYHVSNGTIYTAVLTLQGQVTVLVQQGTQSAKEIVDHEARLRNLEKGRWPLASITALVALAALLLPFFVK